MTISVLGNIFVALFAGYAVGAFAKVFSWIFLIFGSLILMIIFFTQYALGVNLDWNAILIYFAPIGIFLNNFWQYLTTHIDSAIGFFLGLFLSFNGVR
jgi:hypothetical protein